MNSHIPVVCKSKPGAKIHQSHNTLKNNNLPGTHISGLFQAPEIVEPPFHDLATS
jgi:hypothetical protein